MAQIYHDTVARHEVFRTVEANQSLEAMKDEIATFKINRKQPIKDEITLPVDRSIFLGSSVGQQMDVPIVTQFDLASIKGLSLRSHLLQHGANQHVDDSAAEYAALRAALLNAPQSISPSLAQAAQAPDSISAAFPNTLAQLQTQNLNPVLAFQELPEGLFVFPDGQLLKTSRFFACFKLIASTVPEGFVVAEDNSPEGHCTICPVGPPHANHASVKVAVDKLMCPALRDCWELHCLTFLKAAAEPRPFQPNFDKDCWEAARVIFCQLSELDFEASQTAHRLLVLFDEQDYPSLLELDAEGTSQLWLLFEKLVETQMDRDTWEELIRLRDGNLGTYEM